MSWKTGEAVVGYVTAIDEARALARVRFPERDNLVSGWLQVGMRRTRNVFGYAMPAIDEHVLCLLLGQQQGVILCSLYDRENAPPASGSVVYTQTPAGDLLLFDLETGALTIVASGGVALTGNLLITGDLTVTGSIAATGDITAGGISVKAHRHGQVQIGVGTSGLPQ